MEIVKYCILFAFLILLSTPKGVLAFGIGPGSGPLVAVYDIVLGGIMILFFAGTSSFVLAIIARETVHYFRRHGISKQSIVRFVLSCCALVAFLLVLFYVFSSEVGYAAASMVIGGGVYAFLRMHGISKRIAISVAIYCSLFLLFLFVL